MKEKKGQIIHYILLKKKFRVRSAIGIYQSFKKGFAVFMPRKLDQQEERNNREVIKSVIKKEQSIKNREQRTKYYKEERTKNKDLT